MLTQKPEHSIEAQSAWITCYHVNNKTHNKTTRSSLILLILFFSPLRHSVILWANSGAWQIHPVSPLFPLSLFVHSVAPLFPDPNPLFMARKRMLFRKCHAGQTFTLKSSRMATLHRSIQLLIRQTSCEKSQDVCLASCAIDYCTHPTAMVKTAGHSEWAGGCGCVSVRSSWHLQSVTWLQPPTMPWVTRPLPDREFATTPRACSLLCRQTILPIPIKASITLILAPALPH